MAGVYSLNRSGGHRRGGTEVEWEDPSIVNAYQYPPKPVMTADDSNSLCNHQWDDRVETKAVDEEDDLKYVREFRQLEYLKILEVNERWMSQAQNVTWNMSATIPGVPDDSVIPGGNTEFCRGELEESLYARYDTEQRYIDNRNLAIYASQEQILGAVNSHQVTIIEGFTGCGKTTQVPQFLLDEAISQGKFCKIVVTQPRRIAAVSVATRVCQERGWELGKLVGYQVGMDRKFNEDSRLVYMTTGVLLQMMINKKKLDQWTHIVIDEVHERDLDTDLLMLVIKRIMIELADTRTKIVLMSATLNAQKFMDYFPAWSCEGLQVGATLISIPHNTLYPISEHYINSTGIDLTEEEPRIAEETYKMALDIIISLDVFERNEHKFSSNGPKSERNGWGVHTAPERGAVLVFLPGLLEIETMYKILSDALPSRDKEGKEISKWTLLPLHSTITNEEQQRVFLPVGKGFRKIILATNIAESSITVTDIKYVIDFCLTKSLSCDPNTNYTCLRMEWASKNQCIQRKGRCGRVSPGHVYRMVPQTFYNNLVQEAAPEMKKSSLESVVLHAKMLNMGSPIAILALAIDPPKLSGIRRAVANLKEVGALTIYCSDEGGRTQEYNELDGDLTYLGRVMAKLPIDMRFGRLIMMGHVFGLLDETIIIAAGLSTKSPFSYPYHRRLQAYLAKLYWSQNTFSDCFALVRVYRMWIKKYGSGVGPNQSRESFREDRRESRRESRGEQRRGFRGEDHHREFQHPASSSSSSSSSDREPSGERSWAKQYLVQLNVMKEIKNLVEEIRRRLQSMDIEVEQGPEADLSEERGLLLKIVIAGAFYPNYFITRPKSPSELKEYDKSIYKELVGRNPATTVYLQGFPNNHPARLYEKHILKSFEGGSADGEMVIPYVEHAEGSTKLLVSFDSRGQKIGSLSHGLYRAVKMRMLRQIICFRVLREGASRDALAQCLSDLSLEDNSHRAPPQIPLPTILEKSVAVVVTLAISPSEFYVVRVSDLPSLARVEQGLKPRTTADMRTVRFERLRRGDLVFILSEENAYVRGRVELILEDRHRKEALIYRMDRGGISFRKAHQLFWPKSSELNDLYEIPGLAIQCRVRELKAPARLSGTWPARSRDPLNDLVVQKSNVVFEIFSIVESVMAGDVLMPSKNQSLRKYLLELGLAEESLESRDSEENFGNRISSYVARQDGTILGCLNEKQVTKNVPKPLLPPPPDTPGEEGKMVMVTLRGPNTPLELVFSALSHSLGSKMVMVDGASVNSVALDEDYLKTTSRLLVAGSVGISHRNDRAVARETTLLPALPGLAGLLTLLFSPVAELQLNNHLTEYIGVLAGLGVDPHTRKSAYPDHDMAVPFDAKIDNSDLKLVNAIRSTMNSILRPADAGSLRVLREMAITDTLKLVSKPRERIDDGSAPEDWQKSKMHGPFLPDHRPRMKDAHKDVFQLHDYLNGSLD